MSKILIVLGSNSDQPLAHKVRETLITLGLQDESELIVCSAHRNPKMLVDNIEIAEKNGVQVYIAIAGLAAHLAGAIAARTLKPVIGVPADGGPLNGLDALLSTVQMPGGVPVATVAIGGAGAKNAAFLAARILSLQDKEIRDRLEQVTLEL